MMMPENILRATAHIPTPFLLIEEKVLQANIRRIHSYARAQGYGVRPHVKTHKSLSIARMQKAAGAAGIAVAKAGEAERMAEKERCDITVAYPVLGSRCAERMAALAEIHTLRVAVDSEYLMTQLSEAALGRRTEIGIHIIFDAGLHRCGVADAGQVLALARHAENTPGLRYDGIQIYLGHLYGKAVDDPKSYEGINELWDPVYGALCNAGLRPKTVSSGSTPSLFNTHRLRHINEIRVGTAYLNDYFVLKFNHCRPADCAARIVATVVSDRVPGQVIIDAGSKGLSAKQLLRRESLEMGYVCEYPGARIFRLHEEHGWVDVSRCKHPPRLGQRISIIPVNVALCMNLFDSFYLLGSGGALQKERVDARGCSA
ncbi:MAG: alanine racemase [Desulfobacter sp.]|nr:MAG: alanine racemase [Desulfobacter sp.]